MKIAFIIQRYGTEVLGGSEYLCRLIAERLAAQHDVEVLTTCARDYITWKNEYPEGVGPRPRRHRPPLRQRADARHRIVQPILGLDLQQSAHARRRNGMAEAAGPVVPGADRLPAPPSQQYDVLIFFTYLYATTVLGLEVDPARSILVPTAHDEPAIRLGIYQGRVQPAGGHRATSPTVEQQFVQAAVSGPRRCSRKRSAVGVDLRQQQPYPRMPAVRDEPPTTEPTAPQRRTASTDDERRRAIPVAPARARRGVPAPPSAARPVRAVRRAHRSGQGLRGADRVLQQLREGGRRRHARADGRQADVAARRAVRPLRRPA